MSITLMRVNAHLFRLLGVSSTSERDGALAYHPIERDSRDRYLVFLAQGAHLVNERVELLPSVVATESFVSHRKY